MNIRQFVELCDVENNFCFLPRDGLTFCNCYAKVVLASQGVFIPNKTANDLFDWLDDNWARGNELGEHEFDVCVAVWKNPNGHGHIAVYVPPSVNDGAQYTAAGLTNHKFCTLQQTFGNRSPTIFYHIK